MKTVTFEFLSGICRIKGITCCNVGDVVMISAPSLNLASIHHSPWEALMAIENNPKLSRMPIHLPSNSGEQVPASEVEKYRFTCRGTIVQTTGEQKSVALVGEDSGNPMTMDEIAMGKFITNAMNQYEAMREVVRTAEVLIGRCHFSSESIPLAIEYRTATENLEKITLK